jgi:hypothetical protein
VAHVHPAMHQIEGAGMRLAAVVHAE